MRAAAPSGEVGLCCEQPQAPGRLLSGLGDEAKKACTARTGSYVSFIGPGPVDDTWTELTDTDKYGARYEAGP